MDKDAGPGQLRADMDVSPSILSRSLIPLSVLSLVVSIAVWVDPGHGRHFASFWGAFFYLGGFAVVFLACILVMVRRGERSSFARADKVALCLAVISTAVFIAMALYLKNSDHTTLHKGRVPVTSSAARE
jgi:hypothetical protein